MIATVTLNPSLDEDILVDGLVLDEANRWLKLRRYAGGKGINVSRAIHEQGGVTVAYGFIGGNTGRTLEILLDEEGVLFSFTPIKEETRTNVILSDTRTAQQTRIDAPGPRISKRELERFMKKVRQLRPHPDMLVIAGSVPPGIPTSIYYDVIKEAKERGILTILDSEGQWLTEGIKAKPYLIKPNVHEAEILVGKKLPTEKAVIDAARKLLDTGIEIVVISRGKEGIIAATKDMVVKAMTPTVKVRSTVGAGDCTIAGLALKLSCGESLIEACRLGAAMGTAAVMTYGTELCRKTDVEKLLPKVKVWEIPAKAGANAIPLVIGRG
ncbi:MAG: 1-phosphofructokinase [Chloroflexi bacterium]|nr:1-phosphofructokinase [Chloroflexota bacterium]